MQTFRMAAAATVYGGKVQIKGHGSTCFTKPTYTDSFAEMSVDTETMIMSGSTGPTDATVKVAKSTSWSQKVSIGCTGRADVTGRRVFHRH